MSKLYTIYARNKLGLQDLFIDVMDFHVGGAKEQVRQHLVEEGWHPQHILLNALLSPADWRGLGVSEGLEDEYRKRMQKFDLYKGVNYG